MDRTGVRIGVKRGSAYDLFLTRTLTQATVVRGDEVVAAFRAAGLEVAAGIRQPMTAFVDAHPDVRLLEDRSMQIRLAADPYSPSHCPSRIGSRPRSSFSSRQACTRRGVTRKYV
ncbi:MAG: hypothetical protein ACXVGT_01250 [Oryzihumus sp.]